MVVSSLKRSNDVFTIPIQWWPETVVWQNYLDIWRKSDMTTWLGNTLLLSVIVTVLQVLTGSFAAYGFSKVRFPGRDLLFLCLHRHHRGAVAVVHDPAVHPHVGAAACPTRCGRSSRCRRSARSACS